jgi:hypothetical protein
MIRLRLFKYRDLTIEVFQYRDGQVGYNVFDSFNNLLKDEHDDNGYTGHTAAKTAKQWVDNYYQQIA